MWLVYELYSAAGCGMMRKVGMRVLRIAIPVSEAGAHERVNEKGWLNVLEGA